MADNRNPRDMDFLSLLFEEFRLRQEFGTYEKMQRRLKQIDAELIEAMGDATTAVCGEWTLERKPDGSLEVKKNGETS